MEPRHVRAKTACPAGRRVPDVRCRWRRLRVLRPIAARRNLTAYDSATSQPNWSDSREVIRRFRGLSVGDQQAVIEFVKQL